MTAPVLTDPRWKPYLPIEDAKPITLNNIDGLTALVGVSPPSGSISVLRGTPARNCRVLSQDGVPLVSTRSLGLGRIVFLAFSPFDAPLDTWDGRLNLFRNIGRGLHPTVFANMAPTDQSTTYIYAPGGPSMAPPAPAPYVVPPPGTAPGAYPGPTPLVSPVQRDPFSVKLPPTNMVVMILFAYTVLVVPINLLVLRKLNRSQWAWWTTPIISLGFAGVFFQFASELYSANLSTSSTGLLVVDERSDVGYYAGSTRMFFPRGGRYDLGFKSVEVVMPIDSDQYNGGKSTRQIGYRCHESDRRWRDRGSLDASQ